MEHAEYSIARLWGPKAWKYKGATVLCGWTVRRWEDCREVYLFGSLATGTATERSDIDIGVKGFPPEKFFRLHVKLEKEVPFRVDLIDFDSEVDFFNMLSNVGEIVHLGS